MIKMNKKESLGDFLTRLGCGSERDSCRQNKKYISFIYLFSHSKANICQVSFSSTL